MSDCISREAVLDCIMCDLGEPDHRVSYQGVMTELAFRIASLPVSDTVEVVKCGKCVHRKDATINNLGFLICPASGMEITDDDFCSYGERREANHEH